MVARSPLLDVDEVTYVGLNQTSLDDALEAAEIEQGQTLLGLDASSGSCSTGGVAVGCFCISVEVLDWPGNC